MKKVLCLLLILVMAFSLASCGGKNAGGENPPTAGPTEAPPPSGEWPGVPEELVADLQFLPDNAIDVTETLLGFPGSAPVAAAADGRTVTAEEYLYWLGNMTAYYKTMFYYYYGADLDFSQEVDAGVTWDDRLREMALQNAALMLLVPDLAAEYGVTLAKEDVASRYADRMEELEGVGGEEQYAYQLQLGGVSDKANFRIDLMSALYQKVRDAYEEETAAGLTAEEMAEYIEANDYLRAKHILRLTRDMSTGEEYDEARKGAQLAIMEDIAAQLSSAADRETLFDTLMHEWSEDTGLAANPEGYLFTTGQMVSEFENGTRALAVGEVSPIIASTYGYHIILRLDADCGEIRSGLVSEKFNAMVEDRLDRAGVTPGELYGRVTAEEYYNKLVEFQKTVPTPGGDETGADAGDEVVSD